MKSIFSFSALIAFVLLLSACSTAPKATQGEKDMAAKMGITVEELRNQTPEEHMQAMLELQKKQEMNQDDHHAGEENVEPHDHPEDNLPPSRSRIDAADDHHAGEENVQPHDH